MISGSRHRYRKNILVNPEDVSQVGILETGPLTRRVGEYRATKFSARKVSFIELASHELGVCESGVVQFCKAKTASIESGFRNYRAGKVIAVKIEPSQVEPQFMKRLADASTGCKPTAVIEQFRQRFWGNRIVFVPIVANVVLLFLDRPGRAPCHGPHNTSSNKEFVQGKQGVE